ncbi:MAG TPA: RNA 2',3'-cyclic phosphodiesterase [Polyangia bacterium]|jgi:2'-5' RNA ligase
MTIRAFVAVNLSVAATRRVVDEVEKQKPTVAALTVAWVPPANLHLTLRFVGTIEEALIEGMVGRLKPRLKGRAPLELRARGLGAFPSHEKPRVLWVGLDGGEPLLALQREVEAAMVELGLAREERPFHPHLTVGRVKAQPEGASFTWSSEAELGMSQVSEIVIYESRTAERGAEYLARARLPLGKM